MNARLPKIIMQTWKTKELPEKWKPSQISIQKYMPEWEYVIMTDEDNREFIKNHFPDFLETYDNFTYPIQRADAIRYCWLYINGGLYMDCDFELLDNIDSLFNSDDNLYFVSSSNNKKIITNGFMAAVPRNPFWLEMIESMKQSPPFYVTIDKHYHVMETTGPMALTRIINKISPIYKLLDNEKINPYTMCEVVYGYNKLTDKPHALLRPLEGSSWVGTTGEVYQWCYCNSNTIAIWVVVLVLLICLLLWIVIYNINDPQNIWLSIKSYFDI